MEGGAEGVPVRVRIAALVVVAIALVALGHALGAEELLSADHLRAWMLGLGPLGVLAFVALFAIGVLLHVPGLVFVAAAALAYGPIAGFAAGLAGGVASVTLSFWLARAIGGNALESLRPGPLRRVVDRVHERPIRTIALLRLVLPMQPGLNAALALSRVSFRDYLIGSAIGMTPAVGVVVTAVAYGLTP